MMIIYAIGLKRGEMAERLKAPDSKARSIAPFLMLRLSTYPNRLVSFSFLRHCQYLTVPVSAHNVSASPGKGTRMAQE
jgi:hypothetical protein